MPEGRLPCKGGNGRGLRGIGYRRGAGPEGSGGLGGGGGAKEGRVRSICENEICAFDLRAGTTVGSITDTAMKK